MIEFEKCFLFIMYLKITGNLISLSNNYPTVRLMHCNKQTHECVKLFYIYTSNSAVTGSL